MDLKMSDARLRIGFVWLRLETGTGSCEHSNGPRLYAEDVLTG
jgi:hypothetical protein